MKEALPADTLFSPLIEQAIELSAQWHDQTYRKKRWRDAPFEVPAHVILRVPVIAHVTAVAMTVQRAAWHDEPVAAAFLHDVLEDANRYGRQMRMEELREALGEDVLRHVRQVSEEQVDEDGDPIPWRTRKEVYVARMREASPGSAAISLADKLHNLWSINQGLARGVNVFREDEHGRGLSYGPEEQLWFHEAVLEATKVYDDPRLAPMRERLRVEIEAFRARTGPR